MDVQSVRRIWTYIHTYVATETIQLVNMRLARASPNYVPRYTQLSGASITILTADRGLTTVV